MGIRRHIPNALTCCNLLCGCFATVFSKAPSLALMFVLIAAVFDFLDGLAARALRVYSPLGKDLDSLADMVSFGVAPAVVGFWYVAGLTSAASASGSSFWGYNWLWALLPLLLAVFSALRLAKFNNDNRQKDNFIGLATPSCAILFIALICCMPGQVIAFTPHSSLSDSTLLSWGRWYCWLPVVAVPVLCWLLVSRIPMFSMKFRNLSWADNRVRYIFLMIVAVEAVMAILGGFSFPALIVAVLTTYILVNLLLVYSCTPKRTVSD